MTTRTRIILALAAVAVGLTSRASAQAPGQPPASPEMQAQIRQRLAKMVQSQLGATDSQMVQLGAVNKKYEAQRVQLFKDEQLLRTTARAEVMRGDSADQSKVAKLIEQLIGLQKQRIALVESEQKDLSKFLTPVQRAKYLAIQEQIRKRMRKMREEGGGMGMGGGQGQRRMRPPGQGAPPADPTPP